MEGGIHRTPCIRSPRLDNFIPLIPAGRIRLTELPDGPFFR
jgi:hypothetical protein